jgi:hypothetical protein
MDEYLSVTVECQFAILKKFDTMVDEPFFEDFAKGQRNLVFSADARLGFEERLFHSYY